MKYMKSAKDNACHILGTQSMPIVVLIRMKMRKKPDQNLFPRPACLVVKRDGNWKGRKREQMWSGMKTFGKSGGREYGNSLYFSCNTSVSLKLCQNKELKKTAMSLGPREEMNMKFVILHTVPLVMFLPKLSKLYQGLLLYVRPWREAWWPQNNKTSGPHPRGFTSIASI